MKSKRQTSELLERANNLAYSLENAVRSGKADINYVTESIVKIKNLLAKANQYVSLEYES